MEYKPLSGQSEVVPDYVSVTKLRAATNGRTLPSVSRRGNEK